MDLKSMDSFTHENGIFIIASCNPSGNIILHVFGNEVYRNSSRRIEMRGFNP